MSDESQDLSDEGDGGVSHGVSIADVRLDHAVERLLHALKR